MLRRLLTAAAFCLTAVFSTGTVQAATVITGGITEVIVTAPLGSLGLSAKATGTASNTGARFEFPITGGSIADDGNALIEHEGVGVMLSAKDGTSATVGNFVIDTVAAVIRGTVGDGTDFVDLFDLDLANAGPSGIDVLIGSNLATALTSIFGAPDLTGATFGKATTEPSVVPLPAPALLLLGGLLALGGLRKRKTA